jgi:hypothetical protein
MGQHEVWWKLVVASRECQKGKRGLRWSLSKTAENEKSDRSGLVDLVRTVLSLG